MPSIRVSISVVRRKPLKPPPAPAIVRVGAGVVAWLIATSKGCVARSFAVALV